MDVVFGVKGVSVGWNELCRQAPKNTRDAFEQMRAEPRPKKDSRHMRLRGELGTRSFGGKQLEQWQIEVTGGGRIFYVIDDDKRRVSITWAGCGHPKVTE